MEDIGEEPPDHIGKISKLATMVQDERTLFMDPTGNEIAVCNPSIYQDTESGKTHMIYRARERSTNKYGEISVVKKDGKTILFPEHDYEKDGVEDARLSRDEEGNYIITYVAFNEDQENGGAKIALAKTRDFKTIKKLGIIGPQIRYEDAIKLAGEDSYYGRHWRKELESRRSTNPNSNPFIPNKDAALEYLPEIGKWALWHRFEPAMQVSYADKISDFQNPEFWKNEIKNLEQRTILKPGTEWAKEKVGLGGLPIMIDGRKIGHVHGVNKEENENQTNYTYQGTFAEFNPVTNRVIAIIRDPILIPRKEDVLIEKSEGHETRKYVNFPTAIEIDPDDPETLRSYSGWGDNQIGVRTHTKYHILNELSNPHNAVENWNAELQLA